MLREARDHNALHQRAKGRDTQSAPWNRSECQRKKSCCTRESYCVLTLLGDLPQDVVLRQHRQPHLLALVPLERSLGTRNRTVSATAAVATWWVFSIWETRENSAAKNKKNRNNRNNRNYNNNQEQQPPTTPSPPPTVTTAAAVNHLPPDRAVGLHRRLARVVSGGEGRVRRHEGQLNGGTQTSVKVLDGQAIVTGNCDQLAANSLCVPRPTPIVLVFLLPFLLPFLLLSNHGRSACGVRQQRLTVGGGVPALLQRHDMQLDPLSLFPHASQPALQLLEHLFEGQEDCQVGRARRSAGSRGQEGVFAPPAPPAYERGRAE